MAIAAVGAETFDEPVPPGIIAVLHTVLNENPRLPLVALRAYLEGKGMSPDTPCEIVITEARLRTPGD